MRMFPRCRRSWIPSASGSRTGRTVCWWMRDPQSIADAILLGLEREDLRREAAGLNAEYHFREGGVWGDNETGGRVLQDL
jgi:hypothetical protein